MTDDYKNQLQACKAIVFDTKCSNGEFSETKSLSRLLRLAQKKNRALILNTIHRFQFSGFPASELPMTFRT